jgi:hypothetical protein
MNPIIEALTIAKSRGVKKVRLADARAILGAADLPDPQWLPLDSYQVKLPDAYMASIKADSKTMGRVVRSAAMVTRFGKFFSKGGKSGDLDGVIYQYTIVNRPIITRWAWCLFIGGECVAKGSELPSIEHAQGDCLRAARKESEGLFPQEISPAKAEPAKETESGESATGQGLPDEPSRPHMALPESSEQNGKTEVQTPLPGAFPPP